ncbi:MAG: GNAT family N-acetyltransferase [Variovorax sp.]
MNESSSRALPRSIICNGRAVEMDRMTAGSTAELARFIKDLSAHDLLFLNRDITHPKVIGAWMRALEDGRMHSLVARAEGEIVGCTALALQTLSWSAHVGELRVVVAPRMKSQGLGRHLIQGAFAQAIELGLQKLCVQMTVDQQAAIAVFEELGFRAEALLRKHVMDCEGRLHDLAVLSHDVAGVGATLHAYGISEVFGPAQGAP